MPVNLTVAFRLRSLTGSSLHNIALVDAYTTCSNSKPYRTTQRQTRSANEATLALFQASWSLSPSACIFSSNMSIFKRKTGTISSTVLLSFALVALSLPTTIYYNNRDRTEYLSAIFQAHRQNVEKRRPMYVYSNFTLLSEALDTNKML